MNPVLLSTLLLLAITAAGGNAAERDPVRGGAIRGGAIGTTPPPAAGPTRTNASGSVLADGIPLDAPDEFDSGRVKLTFARLGNFTYDPPPLILLDTNPPVRPTNAIPAAIRAYDGREVALTGFVLATKTVGRRATELLLLRDSATCCFGASPQYNHFARVRMAPGEGIDLNELRGVPVTIQGRLRVEERYDSGIFGGLYHLTGERAAKAGTTAAGTP